jgi:hypothetical protein
MEPQQLQELRLAITELQTVAVVAVVDPHAMQLFLIPMSLYGTQQMAFLSELLAALVVLD